MEYGRVKLLNGQANDRKNGNSSLGYDFIIEQKSLGIDIPTYGFEEFFRRCVPSRLVTKLSTPRTMSNSRTRSRGEQEPEQEQKESLIS